MLFNLGGPDSPEAVQPFLFNLFNDPAIIGLPTLFRWPLAKLISKRRAPIAREIYENLGGRSPLLPNTLAQSESLQAVLNGEGESETQWQVFIAMRYWHPFSSETTVAVKAFDPDIVVLLPLYPQYSTTTSASSLADWRRAAARSRLECREVALCCYPNETGYVESTAALTAEALRAVPEDQGLRLLFSAHGLPKKIVASGDPYQWQVERSAAAVLDRLAELDPAWKTLDSQVCYQSRVGPLEWIGPSTDEEIVRAGRDGLAVVLVPIAFVSEHSETLVELDIEYRDLADESGVPGYYRVPTVGADRAFIEGLARLVRAAAAGERRLCSQDGARICPTGLSRCSFGAGG